MFWFMFSYLLGAISVLAVEGAILLFLFRRLMLSQQFKKTPTGQEREEEDLRRQPSGSFTIHKQGTVWVAVPNSHKDSKVYLQQAKVAKEAKAKRDYFKETLEQSLVQKNARIAEHLLILTDVDGFEEVIDLKGSIVTAVSGGDSPSRKWAKKYPIKLENKNKGLYCGNNVLYVYLETSSEKEAWCKVLRLASVLDVATSASRIRWYFGLKKDFEQYFGRLNDVYSYFLKPFYDNYNQREKINKDDAVSSKVRLFLKKIAKKTSKSIHEGKNTAGVIGSQVEKKTEHDSLPNSETSSSLDISKKTSLSHKVCHDSSGVHVSAPSPLSNIPKCQSRHSASADVDSEKNSNPEKDTCADRDITDQGTFCCNLLFSRLFFDAQRSPEVNASLQALIQRLLSKMRTPTYISGITCTHLDIGSLPPYLYKMRCLPVSTDEEWMIEADIEYAGGAIVEIETRVEAHEAVFQESSTSTIPESDNVEQTIGYLSKESTSFKTDLDGAAHTTETDIQPEPSDASKVSNVVGWRANLSSWKGMLSRLADQVSQMPIALSIRILSLKGTLRISIKPPPSDRLWFSFTTEPDIEWKFEPSIGDRKITFTSVADVIANRIKAAIRDNMVLPNSEDICIPWMQAEKDDWIPENLVPQAVMRYEFSESMGSLLSLKYSSENSSLKSDGCSSPEHDGSAANCRMMDNKNEVVIPAIPSEVSIGANLSAANNNERLIIESRTSTSDKDDLHQDMGEQVKWRDISVADDVSHPIEEKPKRSKRERMKGLGKKMSEKLEEKKRHIEEKGRLIVDKMRGLEKNEGAVSDN